MSEKMHCQNFVLRYRNPRCPLMAHQRQLKPKKLIQGIPQAKKKYGWKDPSGSRCLSPTIRGHLGL